MNQTKTKTMKKLIPFTNATEAMVWLDKNCNTCKTKCRYKNSIELGFITGTITIKACKHFGYEKMENGYVELLSECNHKESTIFTNWELIN